MGLALPPHVRKQLAALPCHLPGARWTAAGNLHLTLTFIGEAPRESIDRISEAMRHVTFDVFPLALHGLGLFDKRVLWAGVTSQPQLFTLQEKVSSHLDKAGIAFDNKPFRPHITLARLRHNVDNAGLERFLDEHAGLKTPSFAVERFHLYESSSTPEGTRYVPLAAFPFTA